jgi:hypothetical protein
MKRNHHFGPERRDGYKVGRDPRTMSVLELEQLGHTRVSLLLARWLRCLDCCNDSTQEVRLCAAVDCPSWPFRMAKNPWRAPLSVLVRTQRARTMDCNRAFAVTMPDKTHGKIAASRSDGGWVPEGALADFSPTENSDDAGGAA